MAKDPVKSPRGSSRSRRDFLRRQPHQLAHLVELIVGSPALGWGMLTWASFIVLCSMIAVWCRQQPLVAAGRIANDTVISRVTFQVLDSEQTRLFRELARRRTPWVYNPKPN